MKTFYFLYISFSLIIISLQSCLQILNGISSSYINFSFCVFFLIYVKADFEDFFVYLSSSIKRIKENIFISFLLSVKMILYNLHLWF